MQLPAKQTYKQRLLIAGGLLLVGILAALVLSARQDRIPDNVAEVITYSTATPDETKPDDRYKWKGSANDPRKIMIPSLGIDAYLQNVGVDQNQEIAVPDNIHLGGWFVDSVRPGSKGLSIIDGHVNGRFTDDAIFSELPNIVRDVVIMVELGDGTIREFTVFTTAEATTEDTPSILFSQDPTVSNQLNLIICVGIYDKASNRYDKRFIVSARLTE